MRVVRRSRSAFDQVVAALQRSGCRASACALQLPKNLSADDYVGVGVAIARIEQATHWWLGDWWAYGEHCYGDRFALGPVDKP